MITKFVLTPIVRAVAAVALTAPAMVAAQNDITKLDVPLTLQERTALKCSAAFAMVAHGQDADNAATRAFPPMQIRGREYFVRIAARMMDERGLDRQQVAMLMRAEAQTLVEEESELAIMPGCLALLDRSGL